MPVQLEDRPESVSDSLECRVYERQNCEVPAACRPASALGDPEAKWDAIILDVSQGGARLVLKRRFEPGTGLAIELPGADAAYTVLAKVVYVKRQEDGRWSLGCRFISELSDSEQEHLLHWTPPDEGPPRIENVRFRLLLKQAALIDCRVKHFQQMETWPLVPGAIFDLNGKCAKGRKWLLSVRVRECVQVSGGWNLTCELTKKPSAAKLLSVLSESLGE